MSMDPEVKRQIIENNLDYDEGQIRFVRDIDVLIENLTNGYTISPQSSAWFPFGYQLTSKGQWVHVTVWGVSKDKSVHSKTLKQRFSSRRLARRHSQKMIENEEAVVEVKVSAARPLQMLLVKTYKED